MQHCKSKKKNRDNLNNFDSDQELWQKFMQMVIAHVDPILGSMLYATELVQFDKAKKIVHVATLKKFILFQDLFVEQKSNYQSYLDRIFGFNAVLIVDFCNVDQVAVKALTPTKKNEQFSDGYKQVESVKVTSKIVKKERIAAEFADAKKWKITHALLDSLGGSICENIKDSDEFHA